MIIFQQMISIYEREVLGKTFKSILYESHAFDFKVSREDSIWLAHTIAASNGKNW